jgi:hypothetical protein
MVNSNMQALLLQRFATIRARNPGLYRPLLSFFSMPGDQQQKAEGDDRLSNHNTRSL